MEHQTDDDVQASDGHGQVLRCLLLSTSRLPTTLTYC